MGGGGGGAAVCFRRNTKSGGPTPFKYVITGYNFGEVLEAPSLDTSLQTSFSYTCNRWNLYLKCSACECVCVCCMCVLYVRVTHDVSVGSICKNTGYSIQQLGIA